MKKSILIIIATFIISSVLAIEPPNQTSPTNEATDINPQVSLMIDHVAGAVYYDFQLDTSANFDSPELIEFTIDAIYWGKTVSYLRFEEKYYWKVRTRTDTETSDWSGTWNFIVMTTITLSSPANASTNINSQTAIFINQRTGIDFYDYQIDTSANFDSPLLEEYSHNDDYSGKTISDLRFGQKYYWRARGRHAVDTTEWTEAWNFTVMTTISQSSPANGATNVNPQTAIYINPRTGIDFYDYQIDTSANFDSPLLEEHSHNDDYSGKSIYDLRFGQKYYWRARGRHAVDTTEWTEAWDFTVMTTITQSSPTNGATNQNPQTAIYINPRVGIDFYDYQVDTSANFNSSLLEEHSHNDDYSGKTIYDLRFGQKYYWRARGRHLVDTTEWTGAWEFTVTETLTLSSPNNGDYVWTGMTINWNSMPSVNFYQYQIDTANTFNSNALLEGQEDYINSSSSNSDTEEYINDLYFGQTYYWRVRAMHNNDTCEWTMRSFITKNYVTLNTPANEPLNLPEIPILSSPENEAIYQPINITFDWEDAANAIEYIIEYADNPLFSSSIQNTNDVSEYSVSGLILDQIYYWRVYSTDGTNISQWSEIWSFTTGTQPLSMPILVSPVNAVINQELTLDLDWNSVTNATT